MYIGTSIHFTDRKHLETIRRAAKKAGLSASAFIRDAALKAAEGALRRKKAA